MLEVHRFLSRLDATRNYTTKPGLREFVIECTLCSKYLAEPILKCVPRSSR